MDRRTFLWLSSIASLRFNLVMNRHSSSRFSPKQSSSEWPLRAPGPYGVMLGSAMAAQSGEDRGKLVRQWRALTEVYRLSQQPNPGSPTDVSRAVDGIINASRNLDWAAYTQIHQALLGEEPDFAQERDRWAHGLGLGVKTIGPFVGLVNPAAGMATSVVGIWAEDTLKYLSQPGLNLSVSLLPPTNSAAFDLVNAIVFAKITDLYSNPNFQGLINNPVVSGQLGIDFSLAPSVLTQNLPETTRNELQPLVQNSPTELQNNSAVLQAMMNGVSAKVEELQRDFVEYSNRIEERLRSAENERQLQATLRQLERTRNELNGAIAIGTAMIGQFFGNPELARHFNTIFSTGVQIWETAEKFALNQVGVFAMLGAVVGGLGAIAGLFSSAPSLYSLLEQGFNRLHQQIFELGKHLDERLNQIAWQQVVTLRRLDELYVLTLQGQRQAAEQFAALRATFEDQSRDQLRAHRGDALAAYALKIRDCRRLFATGSGPDFTQPNIQQEYRTYLTASYEHAITTSRKIEFSADVNEVESARLFAYVSQQLSTRGRVDLLYGLMPVAFSLFRLPLVLPPLPPDETDQTLNNPIEWARGVQGYIETRTLTTAVESTLTNTELQAMWHTGLRLRSVAIQLGSSEMLHAAIHALSYQSDLWRYLYSLFSRWIRENLTRFDSDEAQNARENDQYANRRLYVSELWSWDGTVFRKEDPILAAEANGLISRRVITETNGMFGDLTYHKIEYKVTVLKEGELRWSGLGPNITIREIKWSDNGRIEVIILSGTTPQSMTESGSGFLNFCIRLFRKYVEWPNKRFDLSIWLSSQLEQPSPIVYRFETVAGFARLCLATSYLCTTANHSDALWDLRAAPVLSTRGELIQALQEWINGPKFLEAREPLSMDPDSLSFHTNPGKIAWSGLQALIEQRLVVDRLEVVRGPYIIDETLRRLAGFMKARGLAVDLPDLPESSIIVESQLEADFIKQFVDAAPEKFASLIQGNFVRVLERRRRGLQRRRIFPSPLIAGDWAECVINQSEEDPKDIYVDANLGFHDGEEIQIELSKMVALLATSTFENFVIVNTTGSVVLKATKSINSNEHITIMLVRVPSNLLPDWMLHLYVLPPGAPTPSPDIDHGPLLGEYANPRRVESHRERKREFMEAKIAYRRALSGQESPGDILQRSIETIGKKNSAKVKAAKAASKRFSKSRSKR